jgi:hypothetical protein
MRGGIIVLGKRRSAADGRGTPRTAGSDQRLPTGAKDRERNKRNVIDVFQSFIDGRICQAKHILESSEDLRQRHRLELLYELRARVGDIRAGRHLV